MRGLLVSVLAMMACGPDATGGGSGTVIGDGDATGAAASGVYEVESVTTSCSGSCSITVQGVRISACDLGTRLDNTFEVTQTEGHLVIDSSDSDYVSRMEGGLDADGSFDVKGTRTEQGGAITITIRSTGTITSGASATLIGSATGRVSGTVQGQTLSCSLAVDLDGQRSGDLDP